MDERFDLFSKCKLFRKLRKLRQLVQRIVHGEGFTTTKTFVRKTYG